MRLDLYFNEEQYDILDRIGLSERDIERYRGSGIEGDEIVIHTRTGGGNRETSPNLALLKNPFYLRDTDDQWDSTYANYYFRIPTGDAKDQQRVERYKQRLARNDRINHDIKRVPVSGRDLQRYIQLQRDSGVTHSQIKEAVQIQQTLRGSRK